MEEWREAKTTDGKCKVSSLGRVIGAYGKILHPVPNYKGYLRIKFYDKNGKYRSSVVHRLVAEAFIPNPDNKPQVNHKNGNKADNRVENLEWVTPSENMLHSYRVLGTKPPTPEKVGAKKVRCVETGEVFDSIKHASRKKDVRRVDISACCNKRKYKSYRCGEWRWYTHKTAGGYHWEFC